MWIGDVLASSFLLICMRSCPAYVEVPPDPLVSITRIHMCGTAKGEVVPYSVPNTDEGEGYRYEYSKHKLYPTKSA